MEILYIDNYLNRCSYVDIFTTCNKTFSLKLVPSNKYNFEIEVKFFNNLKGYGYYREFINNGINSIDQGIDVIKSYCDINFHEIVKLFKDRI
jgi:hypothetical protein